MDNTLSKKTKAELISAYEALLAERKNLGEAAAQHFTEDRMQTFSKAASDYSSDAIRKTLATLRNTSDDAITQFASALETEVRKFQELREEIARAEGRLKLVHHLEMGADVASQLVKTFEAEKNALDADIASRKRDFAREQEESQYRATVMRTRAEEEFSEKARVREMALKAREEKVALLEKEQEALRARSETLPVEVEKEAEKRLAEAKKIWDTDTKRTLAEKEKEREHTEQLHALAKKGMETEIARLISENALLRKEAEQANRKAQDLAVKIVERGSGANDHTVLPAKTE